MAQINANPGFAGRIIASLDPAVIAELARRTSVGFPRLEAEMPDDTIDLKSQAQDMGLWVDYVNPHGMKVRLKFTIPPEREIQLNYRGLCPDDTGLSFLTFSRGRAHKSKGMRPRLKRLVR